MLTLASLATVAALLPNGSPSLLTPDCVNAKTQLEAPATATRSEISIINETPQGRSKEFALSSYYFTYNPIVGVQYMLQTETACDIVFDDASGAVYLNHFFGGVNTGTWLKGTRDGDKVTFTFPQAVYLSDAGIRYATVFNLDDEDDDNLTYMPAATGSTMTFTFDAEGNLKSPDVGNCETDFPKTILGLTEPTEDPEDLYWSGFGDANMVYEPFGDEQLPVPAGLNWEKYALEHFSYIDGTNRTEFHRTMVDVAIDGDFAYLRGLSTRMPQGVMKGKLGDGKITFPTHQYLGKAEDQFIYLEGTSFENVYDEDNQLYRRTFGDFQDYITFTHDPVRKRLSNAESAVIFNCSTWRLYMLNHVLYPKLQYVDVNAVPGRPAKPVIRHTSPYVAVNRCEGRFQMILPDYDENGTPIDHSKLYYEVYANDSDIPMTFAGDMYFMTEAEFGGPLTQIPYEFTDNFNIVFDEYTYEITYYTPAYTNFAVKLFYKVSDTETLASELAKDTDELQSQDPMTDPEPDEVTLNDLGHTSAVNILQTATDARVVGRYNLLGFPVREDYKGMQIVVMSDGSTLKILRK